MTEPFVRKYAKRIKKEARQGVAGRARGVSDGKSFPFCFVLSRIRIGALEMTYSTTSFFCGIFSADLKKFIFAITVCI